MSVTPIQPVLTSPVAQTHHTPIHNKIPVNQQTQTMNPKDHLKNLFSRKRDNIESLVSDSFKRKVPGFVGDLIISFIEKISSDQNLLKASSDSMVKAIYFCARKGLSLSQDQVHLVNFKNSLTAIIGVNGYRELLRRNPRVLKVGAYVVREKDEFKITLGTSPHILHHPNIMEESKIIGSYAFAEIKEGGYLPIFCNRAQLDKVKNESKSSFTQNLWMKHEEQMSKVLPLKKLGKELGVDTECDTTELYEGSQS